MQIRLDKERIEVKIDGSFGEGGGQIIRICCGLSHILGIPIDVVNIRRGRAIPGLRSQHMTGILFLRDCFGHSVEGAQIKSTELKFYPAKVWNKLSRVVVADTKTAGSTTLIAQMVIPVFLFPQNQNAFSKETVLEFIGGTNVEYSPQIDTYMVQFIPLLKKYFNVSIELELVKRGFFPYGGGKIRFTDIKLNNPDFGLSCINLTERGDQIKSINVQIIYTNEDCKQFAADFQKAIAYSIAESKNLKTSKSVSYALVKELKSHVNERQVICVLSMQTDKDCMFTITVNCPVRNSSSTTSKKGKYKEKKKPADLAKEATEFLEKQ